MSLQAQQKPELQQLASAVTVATQANQVLVSARIPYELLDALQPEGEAGTGAGAGEVGRSPVDPSVDRQLAGCGEPAVVIPVGATGHRSYRASGRAWEL